MYMESVLSGQPQFIIASINLLITIAQSRHIVNLEEITAARIRQTEQDGVPRDMSRYRTNWHLLLTAWWMLAGVAMITLLFRIIPSMFVRDSVELTSPWFIFVDMIVIIGTFAGYSLLAVIAFRAWKWNSWQGKTEPNKAEYEQ